MELHQMQGGSAVSVSPSFNSYSSSKLAEIAARVVKELRQETDPDDDIFSWAAENPPLQSQEISNEGEGEGEEEEEDEEEFEFAVVCREPEYSSPISADEIFYNGRIKPLYPIFDQTLLLDDSYTNADHSRASKTSTHRRSPLKKLMVEEREREQQEEAREPMSCSSSEADELDGVPPGTYCVWAPTKPSSAATDAPRPPPSSSSSSSSSPGRRKKSLSTGSSKRWKLRDLLYRSNSDGKDTFVFVTPSKKAEKTAAVAASNESGIKAKVAPQQLDPHYVRNSSAKEEDHKRRSYLPYRKDLVGFFANVNGLNRSLQPF
ncbi:uncharacterized protein LOC132175604 [Corylus avellana]|uniref:uncharacterized protein LOC132175604 n=1 Tax=Corylus avellana TaxID=13451 RepID=UPI00286CAEE0|nr:uncharacterized protein LOC132175604 [Corylus avellana]